MMLRLLILSTLILCASPVSLEAQSQSRPTRIAVLDFGDSPTGGHVADNLAQKLSAGSGANSPANEFQILDRDLSRAAALGAGYRGSLNLTLPEARNLGATIGCDFFLVGDAQTLRRSPSTGLPYFESYAAIYLVSGRTGKLSLWERPSVEKPTAAEAEQALLLELGAESLIRRYQQSIRRSLADEQAARAAAANSADIPVLELLSDESGDISPEVKAPKPFRRLKPPYPETAARAAVEATVDVLVDIDAQGEVQKIEVSRWAGYGLDQSVIDTVKQLHFFPAMRNGTAIPIRVLLRYNFRKPPTENRQQ